MSILRPDPVSASICLAYQQHPYFERNIVPASAIAPIFQQFKALRFSDETIYLRADSLNLVDGTVTLNFSCDGSHYLNYREFLELGLDFWIGSEPTRTPSVPPGPATWTSKNWKLTSRNRREKAVSR